jgi:class 3 adenylate cyclase
MTTPRYPEERRIATVMFADIEGFTTLSKRLDFEEVTDLIKEVWARVDAVIESHGGYIDKHIGDAVMAVWGAPYGGEDDAERAVKAALALQTAMAEYAAQSKRDGANTLRLRVALNTGPVLAGYVGSRDEYTMMGDTVNVASRLQHLAEPGAVVVSESTYRLVRGAFRVRRLEPMQVKGKSGLLSTFIIEGPSLEPSRVRYRSPGGLETRMVARDSELARLIELYHRSRKAKAPVFAVVRGEVGLGKSRLLMEFTSQLEMDEPGLILFATRGLAQVNRAPFHIWKTLWYGSLNLGDTGTLDINTTRDKFIHGIQSLWERGSGNGKSNRIGAVEVASFVGSLIGLDWPDSPHLTEYKNNPLARVTRAFALHRELLRRISASGPVVLTIDDLHWADEDSLHLLGYLLQPREEPLRMLILASVRPGFLRHQRALNDAAADLISLAPLPISAEIVAEAYPALSAFPESIRAELARRAEGNPYFLEELVKGLSQDKTMGAGEKMTLGQLPPSLQATLQARLDALSPSARTVAITAAVVGRVFWVGAVLAIARQSAGTGLLGSASGGIEQTISEGLAELVRAEMAFPRAGSAFTGEQEYIFKHSLLRDVAYELLPHKYRRLYHLAVAQWLAKFSGADFAAMAAEHYEQAEKWADAERYYRKAADYAEARGAIEAARELRKHTGELKAKI